MTDRADMVGETMSHYRLGKVLGQGGMGIVYEAEDLTLRRRVAVKFLLQGGAITGVARARFLREARSAASLNHPGICSIYELNEVDGKIFIVMEYVEGMTLRRWMEQGGPASKQGRLSSALSTVASVADGLEAAHKTGIVHRDIKPENIMLLHDGRTKIMDFGLAKLSGQTQLTREGGTVGTFAYMSPEQARGETLDHRTDIWSLGVVLYESLSGGLPFRADHPPAMVYQIVTADPLPLPRHAMGSGEQINGIVMRCLAKDPLARYSSMRALALDVRAQLRALEGTATIISPPVRITVKAPGVTRNRSLRAISYFAMSMAVLLAILLWHPWNTRPEIVLDASVGNFPSASKPVPDSVAAKQAVTAFPDRSSPPDAPVRDRAGSAEQLATLLAGSLGRTRVRTQQTVIIQPFTYRSTRISGSFSNYFRTLLEIRLGESTSWRIVEPPANLDTSATNPAKALGIDPEGLSVVSGSYWELKDDVKFLATVRSGKDGHLIGSAEATAGFEVFRGSAFPLKPDNFRQAVEDEKLLIQGEPASGNLRLEAWTNKGRENLVFMGGEVMRLFVRVNRPCNLRIIYHLADGRRTLLTYPSDLHLDESSVNRPSAVDGKFRCDPPFGVESIQIFARTGTFDPVPTTNIGGYHILNEDLAEFLGKTRGFTRINDEDQQAETLLTLTTVDK